jgi:hypothetical protein
LAEITAQAQAKAAEFNGEIAAGAATHNTEKGDFDPKDFIYELEGAQAMQRICLIFFTI